MGKKDKREPEVDKIMEWMGDPQKGDLGLRVIGSYMQPKGQKGQCAIIVS